jgi:hypothetical protein
MRSTTIGILCALLAVTASCTSPIHSKTVNHETKSKLQSIVLPQVDFRAARATDIINFLTDRCFELDDSSIGRKGILIILDVPMPSELVLITLKDKKDMSVQEVLEVLCKYWKVSMSIEQGTVVLKK